MTKFVLGYHGGSGMPESEEEIAAEMAKWEAWFGTIGDHIVDGGNPISQARTINADGSVVDGGGANPLDGYTIIQADTIDQAVELARGCPVLAGGGSIEVAETIDM